MFLLVARCSPSSRRVLIGKQLRIKNAFLRDSIWKHGVCMKSTLESPSHYSNEGLDDATLRAEIHRLHRIRNVGVFAHVDAGKTTVTERMLALAGVVRQAGSVDDGNTVTDYLPAERERGITISSAAISFPWGWHNNKTGDDFEKNDNVTISLIDLPGHVDFSVEVNRSVAVLDGALLVVDSVAGVQAQTETVWRAMTRPSLNNHDTTTNQTCGHAHEPLPCLALINKMDKEGCHFGNAIKSLKQKLPGANPIPIQIPLFKTIQKSSDGESFLASNNIIAVPVDEIISGTGDFVGVVDLIHMRAVVYPDSTNVSNVDSCVPTLITLVCPETQEPLDENCQVTQVAMEARHELIEAMAECDEQIEEYYLTEQLPTNADLRAALRRVTLQNKGLPVMASAALRGKGIEPVLDSFADLLPSPLDRQPPQLTGSKDQTKSPKFGKGFPFGHPLNRSLLAFAFKVVHMKGRGGSGDGRVVFARIYSGELNDRDTVQIVSPPALGESTLKARKERIGGMLELSGGRFGNLENGVCKSGGVCALVGLKSVVTGDTITLMQKSGKKNKKHEELVSLAGVASPKPVLKVRLEAESREQQAKLSDALRLLSIEDPSLVVEETDSSTMLSGLGELHIEVTLDRLQREFGLNVMVGAPFVTYRETITDAIESIGLVNYDRTVGGTRMQAAVSVCLEPVWKECIQPGESACMILADPIITVSEDVLNFLDIEVEGFNEETAKKSEVYKALVEGCRGALKRGPLDSNALANVRCHVHEIDAEEGLAALESLPGALRASAANAVTSVLSENKDFCRVLEPKMSIEITLPNDLVGSVLSDLTGSRRGTIADVLVAEDGSGPGSKALIRGDVPLVEILGYANSLRSLTGGEGAFTAEYKGHSPCDIV